MHKETIKKAEDIVASRTVKNRTYRGEICVLTLIDNKGYPYSTTITAGKSEGIKKIWFGTTAESNKLKYIATNNKASVCFSSETYSISLIGNVMVVDLTDTIKNEIWYDGLDWANSSKVIIFETNKYNIFITDDNSKTSRILNGEFNL